MRRALLARGDTVGVAATGFAVLPARLEAGVRRLRKMGFKVRVGPHALAQAGYLAGSDEARVADLLDLWRDPEVRAIWFARGGYGTARILEGIPWAELARSPKLLLGYSDMTALFAPALRVSKQRCLHAPMVSDLGQGAFDRPSLAAALAGRPITMRLAPRQILVEGRARGRLVGGNLTVLAHALGTRFAPDLSRTILFLEDVAEEAYRIDRALTHLRQSGALAEVRGVVLGSFRIPPTARAFPPDRRPRALFAEAFGSLGIPVVGGIPAGHIAKKWTLPLGGTAEIDTAARCLRLAP